MLILVCTAYVLSVSYFYTGSSRADLFPVPFCICLQTSPYEQCTTALLFSVLPGSNHSIPVIVLGRIWETGSAKHTFSPKQGALHVQLIIKLRKFGKANGKLGVQKWGVLLAS